MGVSNQKHKRTVSVLHCRQASSNQTDPDIVRALAAGTEDPISTRSMQDIKSGHQPPFTVYMFIISSEPFLCAVCTKRAVMRDVKHTKVLQVYVRKYCKQNMLPFVFCFFNHSIL